VTVASTVGAWIYVAYREQLRPYVFAESPSVGFLMERKEHLAFAALVIAWTGALTYFTAPRASTDATRLLLRTVAFRAFACAAALAIVVAVLGTMVAVHRSF